MGILSVMVEFGGGDSEFNGLEIIFFLIHLEEEVMSVYLFQLDNKSVRTQNLGNRSCPQNLSHQNISKTTKTFLYKI